MANATVFDSEIERLGESLKAMREARTTAAEILAEAVRASSLPQKDIVVAEAERLGAEADQRRQVEAELARLVSGVADGIVAEKAEFDRRDVPTGFEAFIGRFSKAALHRKLRARRYSDAPLQRLVALLRQVDMLVGLVQEERTLLVGARKESEDRLEEFIAGRAAEASAQAGDEVSKPLDDFLIVGQAFLDGLNGGIVGCNVMLHKLAADTEDLLLLYRIVLDSVVRYGEVEPEHARFPYIAGAVRRFAEGTLMVQGLDQRRTRADQDFFERFPQFARGNSPTAGSGETGRFGLLSSFGFKFIRS